MKNKESKLLRVGRVDVKSALGFFWIDGYKMYVAANRKDIAALEECGGKLLPMSKLEQAFRNSGALRFVSWCGQGGIVSQGAHQVTFDYADHKSVIHIK